MNPQMPTVVNKKTYDRILNWGAKPVDAISLTTMRYNFVSEKNPTFILNKLKREEEINDWGFISRDSAGIRERKKVNKKPLDAKEKAKKFEELKKLFGTDIGGDL